MNASLSLTKQGSEDQCQERKMLSYREKKMKRMTSLFTIYIPIALIDKRYHRYWQEITEISLKCQAKGVYRATCASVSILR